MTKFDFTIINKSYYNLIITFILTSYHVPIPDGPRAGPKSADSHSNHTDNAHMSSEKLTNGRWSFL